MIIAWTVDSSFLLVNAEEPIGTPTREAYGMQRCVTSVVESASDGR